MSETTSPSPGQEQPTASPPETAQAATSSAPPTPAPEASTPVPTAPFRPIRYWRRRVQVGLIMTLSGLIVFLIGARPSMFGLDRSPIIGFVQIAVFLVGLAVICLGGYISLTSLWREQPTSIAADIGLRLVATGYVISVFAAMADIFGLGSHSLPQKLPYFGEWQAIGVEIGQAVIAVGFFLLIPFHKTKRK